MDVVVESFNREGEIVRKVDPTLVKLKKETAESILENIGAKDKQNKGMINIDNRTTNQTANITNRVDEKKQLEDQSKKEVNTLLDSIRMDREEKIIEVEVDT